MNNNYYQNPIFPNDMENPPFEYYNKNEVESEILTNVPTNRNSNYKYSDNIFKANQGKLATFYMSFSNSVELRDKTISGIIESAKDEYVLVSDPKTGKWYLIYTDYLNFVEFEEPVNYPFIK